MLFFLLGKIRVFCRIRPVNRNEAGQGGAIAVEKIDEYSVTVETPRGQREFQFDKVFSAEASQDDLFHDTHRWEGARSPIGDLFSQIYPDTYTVQRVLNVNHLFLCKVTE